MRYEEEGATNLLVDRRKLLGGGLLAAASGYLVPARTLAAEAEIRLGFVGPVTGPYAELGIAMRAGAAVAVDKINASGGVEIAGVEKPVRLLVGDEESSPERAVAATRRLIEGDLVHGVLGYALATDFLAAMPLLQDAGVPAIDTSGRADVIPRQIAEKKMDFLFQLSPTNSDFVGAHGALIEHYVKPKRIAILAFNTDFAREYASQAERKWPQIMAGVELKSFYVEGNKLDLQPELLQIRRYDPQILWVLLTGTQCYQFVDQFYSAGMNHKMVVLGDSLYGSEQFRRRTGVKVDNQMANTITARRPTTPLTLPFYDAYRAKTGNDPPYYAVQTYDGALMLLEALHRMKALPDDLAAARKALRDALVSIDSAHPMTGARGRLAFSSLDSGRTVPVAALISQYHPGGQSAIVWPLSEADANAFIDPRR